MNTIVITAVVDDDPQRAQELANEAAAVLDVAGLRPRAVTVPGDTIDATINHITTVQTRRSRP